MKKIYKYELTDVLAGCEVLIPDNWNMLDMRYQGDKLCLWALVNVELPSSIFKFVGYATGQELPEDEMRRMYLKTVHAEDGYVWHVFAVLPPLPSQPVEAVPEAA